MVSKLWIFVEKYWDILSYLFFGVLTTVVNWLVYFPLYNWAGISATISTIIAWVVAVAFAYLTNKPFVFKSHDWSVKAVKPELAKFIGCCIGSGAMEVAVIWLTVDLLLWNGNLMKIVGSVLVVVLNYIGSKLLVFKK
jgi:putative flippase GtrA